MSPASREMTTSLVGDLYEQLVDAIAGARKLEPAVVRERLDAGPVHGEGGARARARRSRRLPRGPGREPEEVGEQVAATPVCRRTSGSRRTSQSAAAPTVVALVEVTGTIKSGNSVPGRDRARRDPAHDGS